MILARLLSATPTMDGRHWDLQFRREYDVWHTDLYSQDPAPFQRNTTLSPRTGPPYPWRPSNTIWPLHDALFPLAPGFALYPNLASYPAILSAGGAVPVNTPQTTALPQVPLQATTANTGGSIKPGTYLIGITADAFIGPVSRFVQCVVPAGTSTNTITVANVVWPAGAAVQPSVYGGTCSLNMGYLGTSPSAFWTGSSPDVNGNPTVFTITQIAGTAGLGLPDNTFNQLLIEATSVAAPGVLLDTVTAVSGGTVTLATGGSWTTNQWQNRVLSLYYRPGVSPAVSGNSVISSSAAATVTVPSGSFYPSFAIGDVVAIRMSPSSVTSNSFTDTQLNLVANSMVGNMVIIIAGTGAGQPPKTIKSHTSGLGAAITINGTWDINPDSTSIPLILSPSPSYSAYSGPITNDGSASIFGTVVSVAATAQQAQLIYVVVSTCDAAGNRFPARYQPAREIYLPPQAIPTTSGYFALTVSGGAASIDVVANGGNQVLTLPNSGSLVTFSFTGVVPAAGTKLTLFIRTPASGSWQTTAFTGGPNQFASDVAAGSRYSTAPNASMQDELVFTFHGAGSTVTLGSVNTGAIS